jgi:hypothetical protein
MFCRLKSEDLATDPFILNFCSQPAIAGLDRCRQVHHGKSALTAQKFMIIDVQELKCKAFSMLLVESF